MQHFLIYWTRPGYAGPAFAADVHAPDAATARAEFRRLFPSDVVVGVKAARGWSGAAAERGRFLA